MGNMGAPDDGEELKVEVCSEESVHAFNFQTVTPKVADEEVVNAIADLTKCGTLDRSPLGSHLNPAYQMIFCKCALAIAALRLRVRERVRVARRDSITSWRGQVMWAQW
jgi:hypothetical protein